MTTSLPVIALIYDFDGTLSPKNMQEYDFFPKLGIEPAEFWGLCEKRARQNNADQILTYLNVMLEKCTPGSGVSITKKAFASYGSQIELFPGVDTWFERINAYATQLGMEARHYVLSSGLKEMIEGTEISKHFTEIFACKYFYNKQGVAIAPAVAINYTGKTQFLFRINKGATQIWENQRINAYIPKDQRDIPFTRMLYFGDGPTDVPCMKLVRRQGGHSLALYPPKSAKKQNYAYQLCQEERVNFAALADYRPGKQLEQLVKAIIDKLSADYRLQRYACLTQHVLKG